MKTFHQVEPTIDQRHWQVTWTNAECQMGRAMVTDASGRLIRKADRQPTRDEIVRAVQANGGTVEQGQTLRILPW